MLTRMLSEYSPAFFGACSEHTDHAQEMLLASIRRDMYLYSKKIVNFHKNCGFRYIHEIQVADNWNVYKIFTPYLHLYIGKLNVLVICVINSLLKFF